MDKKDTAIERMSRAMFTRIISSLTRTMQEEELSVAQVAALHLVDERGSMRIGDVGIELDSAAPSTSRMIDDLVDRNFLERKEDATDRRARVVSLTPKGAKFIARAGEARVKAIAAGLNEVPEQTVELVLSIIRRRK